MRMRSFKILRQIIPNRFKSLHLKFHFSAQDVGFINSNGTSGQGTTQAKLFGLVRAATLQRNIGKYLVTTVDTAGDLELRVYI